MPKISRKVPEGVPYYGPKSICKCGHVGDGTISQHHGSVIAPGHGGCKVEGCNCIQFTWAGWTEEFKTFAGLRD